MKKKLTLLDMRRMGYNITSRRHMIASRIDDPAWLSKLAEHLCPWDWLNEGMGRIHNMGLQSAADYYRRCLSEDDITVTKEQFEKLKKSSDSDDVEYKE